MAPDTLILFALTIFVISMTPGLCMTLAFTLGMSCGYRRTLWMMLGELAGVATVAISVAVGVAQVVRWKPEALTWLTVLGAVYLVYVGLGMWRSASGALEAQSGRASLSQVQLAVLGYSTAVLNPKGWAFLIAILPGFINDNNSLSYQLGWLVPIFLISEFVAMSIYAVGGRQLARWFSKPEHSIWLNRAAATLILFIAILFGLESVNA
jgi:threonine/homoserine/homoserine lactone efflux protein